MSKNKNNINKIIFNFFSKIEIMMLFLFFYGQSFAASRYSVATGNWNATSTWSATSGGASGVSAPVAGDVVTIEGGYTVTVTADAACASITFAGTNTATTLTVSPTFTLTLTSTITINSVAGTATAYTINGSGTITGCTSLNIGTGPSPTATVTATLTLATTTLTTAAITLTSTNNGGPANTFNNAVFNFQSGTVNCTGNLTTTTSKNTTVTINMNSGAASGTFNIGGNCSFNSGGTTGTTQTMTFSGGTQIVNFNGTTAQTFTSAPVITYQTLKINNAAGVTFGEICTVTTLTIGDVTSSSIFLDGGNQITSTGTLNLQNSSTFVLGRTGTTTMPAFGTYNISSGTTVEYGSTSSQTVSSSPSYQNLKFTGGGTKSLSGSFTVLGDFTPTATSGSLYIETSTYKLTVNGTTSTDVTGGGLVAWHFTNTGTNYDLLGPLIFGATSGTMWLSCNGAGTGQMIIRGDVTQNTSGRTCSSNGLTTVTFNGSTPQTYTISNSTAGYYFDLGTTTTNIGDGSNAAYVTLTGSGTTDPRVIGNLNIKAGSTLDLGTHTLNRSASGGTLTMEAGSTLICRASTGGQTGSNFPSNFTTYTLDPTSTVIYISANGVNQTIYDVASPGYGNLTLTNSTGSGATTKTAGGGLDIQGNFTISDAFTTFAAGTSLTHNLKGNWVNNNSTTNFTYTTASTINLNGTADQTLGGTANTVFHNLTINKASGVASITINKTVTGTLTFTSGKLSIQGYTLTIGTNSANGTITGQTSARYIIAYDNSGTIGSLKQFVNTAASTVYTYPIGDLTDYVPLTYTLTSASLSSAYLTVYTKDVKVTGLNAAVTGYLDRYWSVVPSGITSSTYTISYTYVDADVIGGTETGLLPIKQTTGAFYKPTNSAFTTGTAEGTGSLTSGSNLLTWTGLTTYSLFGGAVSAAVVLPIDLISFKGKKAGKYNELNWVTASEVNNDYFSIEKTFDGIDFELVGNENGAGTSSEFLTYSMIDYNVRPVINYYRLKQTDFDGKFTCSEIISIDNSQNETLKEIVLKTNVLGQEVNEYYRGLVVIVYSDGSSVKVIQ